jgi:antitoxin CcdA
MRRFQNAPKRAINLSLNAEVVNTAKGLGMNISHTVDELLTKEVLRVYLERWNDDNRAAIEAYNARIEREGTFSQRIRKHLAETADTEAASN